MPTTLPATLQGTIDLYTSQALQQIAQARQDASSPSALAQDVITLNLQTQSLGSAITVLAASGTGSSQPSAQSALSVVQIELDVSMLQAKIAGLSRDILAHANSQRLVNSDLGQARSALVKFSKKLDMLSAPVGTARRKRR